MDRKDLWLPLVFITIVWAIAAVVLQGQSVEALERPAVTLAETIPAPHLGPEYVTAELNYGPQSACPGWTLYYSFALTNTHESVPMVSIVVTSALPIGTWLDMEEIGGTLTGTYDHIGRLVTWSTDTILPGRGVTADLNLRTYSTVSQGTQISTTFAYSGTNIDPGEATGTTLIDRGLCQPVATLTPTCTSSPTATRTMTATPQPTPTETPRKADFVYIPLMWR